MKYDKYIKFRCSEEFMEQVKKESENLNMDCSEFIRWKLSLLHKYEHEPFFVIQKLMTLTSKMQCELRNNNAEKLEDIITDMEGVLCNYVKAYNKK